MWRKLDQESRYYEKLTKEMMNKIGDHEQSVKHNVQELRSYWEDKFKRELEHISRELKQHLDTGLENERADRIRMESERLAAMQKRLEAHEELNARKLEELALRITSYAETTDKRLEVFMKESEAALDRRSDFLRELVGGVMMEELCWDRGSHGVGTEEIFVND